MYEPGRYWAKITGQQLSESSKGTPQLVLTFSLQGGVNPADPEGDLTPCPRGERRIYRAITDKTITWFMDDLRSLGFVGDSFRQLDPNASNHFSFAGKELEVGCSHEEYKGETKERWKLNLDNGEMEPLTDDKIRKLDGLFAKQLKALGNGAAEKPRRAVKPQASAKQVAGAVADDANAAMHETAEGDRDLPF